VNDLLRLGRERRAREKRAQRLESFEVGERRRGRRFPLLQARRPEAERGRDLLEVLGHVDAERAQIADRSDRERQVGRVGRATHRESEAVDGCLGPTHLGEQARRDDDRARHRRVPLDRRGAPPQRGFGLVGQEQRERPIDRRIARLCAGQIRRCGTHDRCR
jgi:hypothetical protein